MRGVACVWKYDRGMVYARSITEMRAFGGGVGRRSGPSGEGEE